MSGMTGQQLDTAITNALEQRPAVTVPGGFAAKVVAGLPARERTGFAAVRRVPRERVSAGWAASMVAMVVLIAVLFVLAPRVGTDFDSWGFAMEMLLLAQLGGVGYGLMRMTGREL